MIQRIQSVYLAIAAILILSILFFDLAWSSPAATVYGWFTPVILIFAALIAIGIVATIFLFGDRVRQRMFVERLQYVLLAFMVLLYASMYTAGDLHFMRDGGVETGKAVAMMAPVAAYVTMFLARRAISKDIAMVRSMDRLR